MTGHPFDFSGVRVAILHNENSGSCADGGWLGRLAQSLGERGAEVRCALDDGSTFADRLMDIREREPGVIVAVGGDGTVNAAAEAACEQGSLLVVAPAGTMNLVAKDLGIPTDADKAVAGIGDFVEARVDVGAVNGRVFVHSSLIGFVPVLTKVRERMRAVSGPIDWLAEGKQFLEAMVSCPELRLSLESDRGASERVTRCLAVTCNALRDDSIVSHRRASLTGGTLGVYASRHEGSTAPFKLAASLIAGAPRLDPEMDEGACRRLSVRLDEARVSVTNDGELIEFDTPLEYEVRPRALRVLVPREVASSLAEEGAGEAGEEGRPLVGGGA